MSKVEVLLILILVVLLFKCGQDREPEYTYTYKCRDGKVYVVHNKEEDPLRNEDGDQVRCRRGEQ